MQISQPAKPDGTENKTAATVNRSGGKVGLFRTEKTSLPLPIKTKDGELFPVRRLELLRED